MKTFSEKVRDIVRKIPKGKVLTYGEVARKAGNAKGARAVGNIMSKNFDPTVPCHRVIRSDGKIGNYNRGGINVKKKILQAEGYRFKRSLGGSQMAYPTSRKTFLALPKCYFGLIFVVQKSPVDNSLAFKGKKVLDRFSAFLYTSF